MLGGDSKQELDKQENRQIQTGNLKRREHQVDSLITSANPGFDCAYAGRHGDNIIRVHKPKAGKEYAEKYGDKKKKGGGGGKRPALL